MRKPLTEAQRRHLADRQVVASVSGGKDSTALALWLKENGIPFIAVFLNTGWEAPETYRYLREVLPAYIGEIHWLVPERQMEELILHKSMFPSRVRRFCTEYLKVLPMRHFLSLLPEEPVNAVGIRHAESLARSRMPEWEWTSGFDCEVWRPLVSWSLEDVIAIHKRHDCPPNPLYLKGAERVSCWPCIFSRKSEIRFIAEQDPARIDRLRELERLVGDAAEIRAQARGEVLKSRPAWFQSRLGEGGECWPIDKVVQWSHTARGGRQYELFEASPEEAGCMRWGLCETKGEP